MDTGVKGLMGDKAQHLGGGKGGCCTVGAFLYRRLWSGSCEMLHFSGGTQPNTGSAAKWSCKRNVRKQCRGIKKEVTHETKDKEKPWK